MRSRPLVLFASAAFLAAWPVVAAAGLSDPASVPHPAPSSSGSQAQAAMVLPPGGLETLLDKVAAYCRKLESAAFDFVCREGITETVDPSLDLGQGKVDPWFAVGSGGRHMSTLMSPRTAKRTFEYDYQCVRSAGQIREVRTLLKENGKDKNEPNARLQTSVVVFGTALMSPVGLFGKRFQPDYDYTVAERDKVGKTRVVVVDAKPKPGAPGTTNLYGKAWIDPVTGDILKIEWSDSRVGGYEVFKKRAVLYNRTPRLVIRSEFRAEKNGVRFPSRLFVEEAYLNAAGQAKVRSKTEVEYKDFKFFTVEVEVR